MLVNVCTGEPFPVFSLCRKLLIYVKRNGSNVKTDFNARNNGAAIFIGRIMNYFCEAHKADRRFHIVVWPIPPYRDCQYKRKFEWAANEATNASTLRIAPPLASGCGWNGSEGEATMTRSIFSVVSRFVHSDAVQWLWSRMSLQQNVNHHSVVRSIEVTCFQLSSVELMSDVYVFSAHECIWTNCSIPVPGTADYKLQIFSMSIRSHGFHFAECGKIQYIRILILFVQLVIGFVLCNCQMELATKINA